MGAEQTFTGQGGQEAETSGGVPRGAVWALLAANVAFAFQQTAVVPAVSDVGHSLGVSSEWSAWLVTVYLIVATVATPAFGRLGDLHGRRRMLIIGLGLFALASVGAAVAPDMGVLLVCRAVQGVGGSVYPLTLGVVRGLVPRERVATVIAASAAAFGVGTVLGFAGGGLLAQDASWRWIFGAGAILLGIAMAFVVRVVPSGHEQASGGYDIRGTALLGIATMTLLVALTLVVPLGWASPLTAGLLLVTAVAGAAWARLTRTARDPLIDLRVLREPRVLRANLATAGFGWGLFSTYILVPEFMRAAPAHLGYGAGTGAAGAGAILVPLAVGQALAGPAAGRLSRRYSGWVVFGSGLALMAAALAWLSVTRQGLAGLAVAVFAVGAGAGTALQSSSNVATQGVAPDVAAVSSALNSTIRRFAGGVGGQVATILLASFTVGGPGQPRFVSYQVAYLVAAAACAAGAVTALLGRRSAG